MRASNRGDIPPPHVPPGGGKPVVDPAEDVVFDAGSLSFVQDWMEGSGGQDASAAVEVEPEREDPRQSNPNRRLGVGAQPKKPKQERPEPSALEKKLIRKRQKQELSDAIAAEVSTHGIAGDDDDDGEGDSKTAFFKGKKRSREQLVGAVEEDPADPSVGEMGTEVAKEGGEPASENTGATAASRDSDKVEEGGEKQGRKRKARRKKGKSGATEAPKETEAAEENPKSPTAAIVKPFVADGGKPEELKLEEPEPEAKKQRRGWGKGRAKSAAPVESESKEAADGKTKNRADERRPRKKTRSRQKNIRKDKRPVGQRPAYLRDGDPEFSGRGLTDETRIFLGLPVDEFDNGNAPPAGWGKPGKVRGNSGWVVDKEPRNPEIVTVAGEDGNMEGVDSGVVVDPRRKAEVAASKGAVRHSPKSKYKNLALPKGKKKSTKKEKKNKA